jgi:hypothetical protein
MLTRREPSYGEEAGAPTLKRSGEILCARDPAPGEVAESVIDMKIPLAWMI